MRLGGSGAGICETKTSMSFHYTTGWSAWLRTGTRIRAHVTVGTSPDRVYVVDHTDHLVQLWEPPGLNSTMSLICGVGGTYLFLVVLLTISCSCMSGFEDCSAVANSLRLLPPWQYRGGLVWPALPFRGLVVGWPGADHFKGPLPGKKVACEAPDAVYLSLPSRNFRAVSQNVRCGRSSSVPLQAPRRDCMAVAVSCG